MHNSQKLPHEGSAISNCIMFRASRNLLRRSSSLQRIDLLFETKYTIQVDQHYEHTFVGVNSASHISRSISSSSIRKGPLTLLARNKRPLYSRDAATSKPWHDPNFLSDAPAREKEEWLSALLGSSSETDIQAFELVIRSIATWKHGSAPKRAEHWMLRLRKTFPAAVEVEPEPSEGNKAEIASFLEGYLRCHLYTIQSWANADADDPIISVNRAEAWLSKAKLVAARAPVNLTQPIISECHNAFLDACSRGRASRTNRNSSEVHAAKAEAALEALIVQYKRLQGDSPVRPDTESFNFVMRSYTQCRKETNSATKCKELLDWMVKSEEKSQNPKSLTIRPNPKSYNLWLSALANVMRIKAKKSTNRNRRAQSGGSSQDDGTAEMQTLQQAVDHMRDLFQRGRLGVIENNIPYNILLSAWAGVSGTRHDAPMQAEKVFRTMVDLKENHNFPEVAPDAATYLPVIRAWAASGSKRAGERAEWWIGQQWKDYEPNGSEKLLPTTRTYAAAISAWSKAGNPQRAEELLLLYLERYDQLKVPQLQPNTEIYAALIQAWLNAVESKENGHEEQIKAYIRAVEWLESLIREESDSGPATRHDMFLNTLKAARHCAKNSPDVLETTSRVFNHLRNSRHHVQPVAYSCLLQVGLSALSNPADDFARTKFLTELVAVCRDDGFLSRTFVVSLTNGPIQKEGWNAYESARLSSVLFPNWPISPAWTRNLHKESDLPRAEDFQRTRFKFE